MVDIVIEHLFRNSGASTGTVSCVDACITFAMIVMDNEMMDICSDLTTTTTDRFQNQKVRI